MACSWENEVGDLARQMRVTKQQLPSVARWYCVDAFPFRISTDCLVAQTQRLQQQEERPTLALLPSCPRLNWAPLNHEATKHHLGALVCEISI